MEKVLKSSIRNQLILQKLIIHRTFQHMVNIKWFSLLMIVKSRVIILFYIILTGVDCAMPRDFLLIVGNEMIESTMTWRSRYFEFMCYKKLINDYWRKGAKWTAAPKPMCKESLFKKVKWFIVSFLKKHILGLQSRRKFHSFLR